MDCISTDRAEPFHGPPLDKDRRDGDASPAKPCMVWLESFVCVLRHPIPNADIPDAWTER
jgi:hypothetical protein